LEKAKRVKIPDKTEADCDMIFCGNPTKAGNIAQVHSARSAALALGAYEKADVGL